MKNKIKPQELGRKAYGAKNWAKPQAAKPSPSPLPWVESNGTEIKDARGTLCAIASSFHLPHKEAIENRALIVRAVTAHAGLVEMFRALIRVEAGMGTKHKLTAKEVADHARAALRAAGEAV